jgi:hypothetical protein
MRVRTVLSSLLAVTTVVLAGAPQAQASHFRYGTLSWAPTGTPGEVQFELRVALRRNDPQYGFFPGGIDNFAEVGDIITENIGDTQLIFGDGTGSTGILQMVVTDFSQTENWMIALALDPITGLPGIVHPYSGAGPHTARLGNSPTGSGCCRLGSASLNNRSNGSYPLQTIVRPNAGNSSPVSSLPPVIVVPESTAATFTVPASDPDGDGVRFRLASATEAGTGPAPLHPGGLTIDANTGVVTWNNMGLDRVRFWTTQVVIEDLDANGLVKTKTPVDFLLKIVLQQGTSPQCAVDPPGPFSVAPGTPVTFTVTGTDPDTGDLVTLNGSSVPPGATLSPPLPTTGPSGVSSVFAWTPGVGGTFVVSFSATDIFGNQGQCSATINVITNVAPTISCAADVKLSCAGPGGTSHTLTSHVEDADGDELTVTWRVDGTVVETDTVPAPASGPTVADVTMTHSYAVGAHTVEVTVDDGQAVTMFASASCTTVVTVVDDAPPVVVCTVADSMLWPPNHNLVRVGLTATATDACTGNSGPATVAVFGDEDDEDPTGDGRHAPDAKEIAHQTLLLRSEREGDQNGRVYLIRSTATDGNGSGHACCTVTVPLDMSPRSRADVLAQAAAAQAVCQATGAPPPGYFVIGDGPVFGPKQTPRYSEGAPVGRPRAVRGDTRSGGKRRQ